MMTRKLIPAAVLLTALGAAQAQVSVYGLLDMSYGKSITDDALGKKADFHSGGDDGSAQGNSATVIGIKGSQDVATGIKVNFQLESGGITSNGEVNPGGAFFSRQAWLGFSGGFGEVRLGKQDSVPYQTMLGFDFNGGANAASAQANAGVAPWLPGRQARALQYLSPNRNGFKAQVGFVPEGKVVGDKSTYSVGVNYTAGPIALGLSAETARSTLAGADASFASVAGSYDFGVAKIMAGYADGGTQAKGVSLGVVAPVAGFNLGMNYSKNSDTQAVATELFVNREVFKNTFAYFDYGNVDKDAMWNATTNKFDRPKGNAYAVGVIFTF